MLHNHEVLLDTYTWLLAHMLCLLYRAKEHHGDITALLRIFFLSDDSEEYSEMAIKEGKMVIKKKRKEKKKL